MAKRRLLQWMRERLVNYAKENVAPAKEQKALASAYKKAEPIDAALAAPASGEVVSERWYLGSMNDGLFIINKPPRPSTDDVWHDRPDGPSIVLNVTDLPRHKAQAIVDAHNATPAPTAPVRDGWDDAIEAWFEKHIAVARKQQADAYARLTQHGDGLGKALHARHCALVEARDAIRALTRPAIEAERDTGAEGGAARAALDIALEAIQSLRTLTATDFTSANAQGQRGSDRCDAFYDAYAVVKKLRDAFSSPAAVQSVSDPAPESPSPVSEEEIAQIVQNECSLNFYPRAEEKAMFHKAARAILARIEGRR